jgi:hypothetical protein
VGEAADRYTEAFHARAHLAATTKRNAKHYVGKAIRLMGGGAVAVAAIDARSVRLMLDAIDGSAFERHHVFGAFNRFMTWCVKRADRRQPLRRYRSRRSAKAGPFARSHAANRNHSARMGRGRGRA